MSVKRSINQTLVLDDNVVDDLEILYALGERNILVDANYTLAARYCEPAPGIRRKDTLQVLVHGGTFNKVMWDLPFKPETYSWTRFMTLAGYSTLAVDLVGMSSSYTVIFAVMSVLSISHSPSVC